MPETQEKPVGLTRDVGWQIGARRTLDVGLEEAWEWLISQDGVLAWLGEPEELIFEVGQDYSLADGSYGEIRVFKPNSHLRMTYQPGGWSRPSTIQVRVMARKDRTSIIFHEEHLPDAEARQQRRQHYFNALDVTEEWVES
ncbi:MAG: SRPBCC domain-containing protein [Chloroflexi bacterium]|nr:SRPBCC domain-containing protein [Chloroflexota bacterium]